VRRSLRDFQTLCEEPREPSISESQFGRLAETSPQLAPPIQSYAALVNAGARFSILRDGGTAGDARKQATSPGKLPERRRGSWLLATISIWTAWFWPGRYSPKHLRWLRSVGVRLEYAIVRHKLREMDPCYNLSIIC
jgi:hypothetical protein